LNTNTHEEDFHAWTPCCFSAIGAGYVQTYNGTVNAIKMKQILDENLIPTAEEHGLITHPPQQWYFLHDNAPTFEMRLYVRGYTIMELHI
jgi:hypothetical protein